MKARLAGVVESVKTDRRDVQEIDVRAADCVRPAINYPVLTGRVQVGDRVTINTAAVELGLGTGGVDFVTEVSNGDWEITPAGHIMKLRYTPMQLPVLAAESPESPHHEDVKNFRSLETIPVVCAELHSQIPAIAAAAKGETQNRARIVYVMTDSAALPLAYSRLVPEMRERGLIDATVTSGHAFGGDFEAVNLYSALAVARTVCKADIILVCQGPGNTGTQTPLGFSGIDQGIALNAAASLDGTAICAVRMSFADSRARHHGVSHHTKTVLERVAMAPVLVALPRLLSEKDADIVTITEDLDELSERHEFVMVDAERGLRSLTDQGFEVTTMGRQIAEERPFFLAAAAAGLLAGQWVKTLLDEA